VTQQNASASEQMSATSEELASQAEALQHTIGFFTVEQSRSVRKAPPAYKPAEPTHPVVAHVAPARSAAPARAVAGAARVVPMSARKGKAKGANGSAAAGYAFDLSAGGPDGQDAEFERC